MAWPGSLACWCRLATKSQIRRWSVSSTLCSICSVQAGTAGGWTSGGAGGRRAAGRRAQWSRWARSRAKAAWQWGPTAARRAVHSAPHLVRRCLELLQVAAVQGHPCGVDGSAVTAATTAAAVAAPQRRAIVGERRQRARRGARGGRPRAASSGAGAGAAAAGLERQRQGQRDARNVLLARQQRQRFLKVLDWQERRGESGGGGSGVSGQQCSACMHMHVWAGGTGGLGHRNRCSQAASGTPRLHALRSAPVVPCSSEDRVWPMSATCSMFAMWVGAGRWAGKQRSGSQAGRQAGSRAMRRDGNAGRPRASWVGRACTRATRPSATGLKNVEKASASQVALISTSFSYDGDTIKQKTNNMEGLCKEGHAWCGEAAGHAGGHAGQVQDNTAARACAGCPASTQHAAGSKHGLHAAGSKQGAPSRGAQAGRPHAPGGAPASAPARRPARGHSPRCARAPALGRARRQLSEAKQKLR